MNILKTLISCTKKHLQYPQGHLPISIVLLSIEIPLCLIIISQVRYTEIDWVAYMQEVESFLNGTLDYDLIEGQTGPCVYPAGFLYFYSLLYRLTSNGSNVKLAQYIFCIFYGLTLVSVFSIYRRAKNIPPYVMIFMCFSSYRVHSIYVLRLFNDPIAMMFVYLCINQITTGHWSLASIFFSLGVSIKMNVLLFAPGLLAVLLWHRGILETIGHLSEMVIIQLLLGAPFLFHNYKAYCHRAFNFGRQFMYQWTVNWRLVPEEVFLDRKFQLCLLGLHLLFLVLLFVKFIRYLGGPSKFLHIYNPARSPAKNSHTILYFMFVSNFVGVVFSRSLHYQFYMWYYHTLPYLLWSVSYFSSPVRILLLSLIELCWNTYPSTVFSSSLLHGCHTLLLFGILLSKPPSDDHCIDCDSLTDEKHILNETIVHQSRKRKAKAT